MGMHGGNGFAAGAYNARALEFTNLGANNEVVLGKHISYEVVAQQRGATYFGTSSARWNEVESMMGVGITNDYISGYLYKEVSYITSKGFQIFLISSGGLWFLEKGLRTMLN